MSSDATVMARKIEAKIIHVLGDADAEHEKTAAEEGMGSLLFGEAAALLLPLL
jgi:hypothetical protein